MASRNKPSTGAGSHRDEAKTEPLAIVGMACRFAGGVKNPEDLWNLVRDGKNGWSPIPAARFNQEAFYHPWGNKRAATPIKGGYFLDDDLGLFDPGFFGLSTDVAAALDPQIRWLLELTFESAESAGLSMQELAGSNTSVYAGAYTQDYRENLQSDSLHMPRSMVTTAHSSMLAARLSHFFDLRGTSMTIDTACSTSTVGLHLACQSLRSGESDCAIVAGSSMNLRPESFINISVTGSCGPDGKCFSFDHRAQGYGRGEGVAVLIVKRLSDALRDRDPIRAVIRETGTNQDGKTSTITSPDPLAQQALIQACYERAGLDPRETDVVEAHGTGTKVGDPIEATAIGQALGRSRARDDPLYIASVKTNIGHTEAVSGLAALIKMTKSLENGQIAPSLNFEKANDAIDFDALRLKVPVSLTPWPSSKVRRASVNNFGLGGTNTHVIIEQANVSLEAGGHAASSSITSNYPDKLFVISARDKKGVSTKASNLADYLRKHDGEISLTDLAYTLGQRRSKFNWTLGVTAASSASLIEELSREDLRPVQSLSTTPRLGFVFNGQGAQWFAMGRELMAHYPIYMGVLQECDAIIKELGADWSVIEELQRSETTTRVNEVQFSMPTSCIVQLALVCLLEAWDITPTAVTGHSTGEIAAAFAAGALDLREAVIASYYRGLINSQHIDSSAPGAMMAVGLGASEVGSYLEDVTAGRVTIACHNSPTSVTLSGDLDAVNEVEKKLTSEGIFARKLRVQSAFHSHHMLPLQDAYLSALTQGFHNFKRKFSHGTRFFSPITGEILDDADQLGPQHWVDNMLKPVHFAESFRNMVFAESSKTQSIDAVVEVGPHSALAGPIRQCLSDPELKAFGITYGSCLERGKNAVQTIQTLAGLLWQKGCRVNMAQVNFPHGLEGVRAIPDLPSYPWNHSTSYWIESRSNHEHRMRKHAPHALLGVRVPGMSDNLPVWRLVLRAEELPWMRDHVIQSEMVYPAAGYIAMAIEAMRQLHENDDKTISGYLLRDLQIEKALRVPDTSEGTEVQLYIEPSDEASLTKDWRKFRIYASSTRDAEWDSIAHGTIAVEFDEGQARVSVLQSTAALTDPNVKHHREVKPQDHFESLRSTGLNYGPLFQNITNIRVANGRSATTITIPNTAATIPYQYEQSHVIHPITLDGVFQSFYSTLSSEASKTVGASVPRSIKAIFVSSRAMEEGTGRRLKVFSKLLEHNRQGFDVAAAVTSDATGAQPPRALVEIEGMHFQSLGRSDAGESNDSDPVCVTCEWERSPSLNDLAPLALSLKMEAPTEEIEISKDLARMTYHFVHDVLSQLTKDDIAGLEWYHKRFYEWMQLLEQKASRNELAPRSERWAKMSEGAKYMLMDKVEKASIHGKLTVRIGKNLLGIMRKEVAPLELMLEGKLLYEFYQHFMHFPRGTRQAGQVVRTIAAENPRLRILEIGAGTGGCTWPVLQALQEGDDALFEHYDFTDVSAGFFPSAKERLSSWGELISYSALDIEKDPEQQGFKLGSYDVIVAAQVLHATKNLDATLKNTRKLLANNGKLVLVETTLDMPDLHLIFGTLPGWWLSEEPERKYSPNIPLVSWDRYLRNAGFSGLDLNVWDCEDPNHHTMSCIMTTVANSREPLAGDAPVIVHADEVPPAAWTKGLIKQIQQDCGAEPALARLGAFDATGKTCIVLSGLGGEAQTFDEVSFRAIKALVTRSKSLLWVTTGSAIDCENPQNALHLGLLRTARLEDVNKRYVSLDLDPSRDPWSHVSSEAITQVLRATMYHHEEAGTVGFEYAERGGNILIPRLHNDASEDASLGMVEPEPTMQPFVQPGRNLRMHVDAPGLLDSIVFIDNSEWKQQDEVPEGWVEIESRAYGLNFKDVMLAMGMLKQKQELGLECAGIVTRVGRGVEQAHVQEGDRVCALTVHGHFGNRVRVPWTSVARLPETMSFETGASFILAFVTAYYSLFNAGLCEVGDKVLVHSASGGVGQACIILLQWKGIEIFATAGTQEKRDFLTATYGIPPDHIFSSRDSTFVDGILNATKSRGVDVVVNSLAGKLLENSWNVLAQHGRFVEIGKRDIHLNKSLGMEPFQRALSFMHVDVVQLADTKGQVIHRILRDVLGLLDNGTIRNISPITTFPISEVGRALRTMQAGNHIGKLVLVPGANDIVKATQPSSAVSLSPNSSYMIIGGLTGIGQAIARWFVDHGAQNLLLVSRSAASRSQSTDFSRELEALGARVAVENCDVGDLRDLQRVIAECAKSGMPSIKGVVHGGMALDDSILENMSYARWTKTTNAKVDGTRNLDAVFGDSLDFLIFLSSIVGVMGNPSQSNYAAGGAYQDAVARRRAAKGQACVSIDLGVVEGVGFVAEAVGTAKFLRESGHKLQSKAEVLALVGQAIRNPRRNTRTAQVIARLSSGRSSDPRFTGLRPRKGGAAGAKIQASAKTSVKLYDAIDTAPSADDAAAAVQQALVEKISDMFVLSQEDIDAAQPLARYGVDSLVAVELRNWLVPSARIEMSIFELLASSSLAELAMNVTRRTKTWAASHKMPLVTAR